MFKRLDQNERLLSLIKWLSSTAAKQRGLPVVIGVVIVILAFITQVINVYADSKALELIGVILQNLGILVALIGLLLAEPLGK
jgi:hypothetical protein